MATEMKRLSYEAEGILALLREHGPFGLGGSDGCRCCHFSNYGFSIDMSCHKSNGGVSDKWHRWGVLRVTTGRTDISMDDYKAIAEQILTQIREPSWDEEYDAPYWLVRFCDWKHDQEQLCVYCSKPREEQQGYLCEKCLGGTGWNEQDKIADSYDYRRIQIAPPPLEGKGE